MLSGNEEILRPRFSFMGGRYIRLKEYPSYIKEDNFKAVFVHSNMERTCFFECDNPKIQRLYLNTYYGQLSNYLDIPTDCPQRDERLGWTADTQIFAKTAAIHFNVNKFFHFVRQIFKRRTFFITIVSSAKRLASLPLKI